MIAGRTSRPLGRLAHADAACPARPTACTGRARHDRCGAGAAGDAAAGALDPVTAGAAAACGEAGVALLSTTTSSVGSAPAASGGDDAPCAEDGDGIAVACALSAAGRSSAGRSRSPGVGAAAASGAALSGAALSGAAPELANGPSRCGAASPSPGRSAGVPCPFTTRGTVPNAGLHRRARVRGWGQRGASRTGVRIRRTRGLLSGHAALRVPVSRLRRHVRGQPPDA